MATKWNVFRKSSGEKLGVIEKFYRNVGTTKKPVWRVWYQLEGNASRNADVRSVLAVFLGGGSDYRMVAL